MIYGFNAGEVFKIAVELEENGRVFYEQAAAGTSEAEVRAVFEELGREEVKHKARFQELSARLPAAATGSTVWDPQNEIDQYLKMMADLHVFRRGPGLEAQADWAGSAEDALKLAIQFEKDSIVFFAQMQALAENQEARNDLGQLVKEEQEHLRKLSLQLVRLKK
ncbi:MAG: ferritin family protein [Thermodesulfobacteriota bacterium]